jgi:peroxiredoxin
LSRGQELIYRGWFTEETPKRTRRYHAEIRILVLETSPTGSSVALLTETDPQEKNLPQQNEPGRRAHLELIGVNLNGRVTLDSGKSLPILQPSPPEIEAGCFVELPTDKTGGMTAWTTMESTEPRRWRMMETEAVDGQVCLKLLGIQQSEDWDHPRADRTAWRRQDTVWLSPQMGLAVQYERVIERRDPSCPKPNQRSTAELYLKSSLVYPGQLFRDRQAEINLYKQYSQLAEACFREPSPDSPRRSRALAAKIAYHCETQPPTAYRAVLRALQDRLEEAARGDLPPIPSGHEIRPVAAHVAASPTAPDFVTTDFATGESIRLQLLRGRPVLLLFYHPRSVSAADLLSLAQTISQTTSIHVLGLSVVDQAAAVLKQRSELKLTFSLANGAELRATYGVDTTPKIIVIDSDGIIRRTFEGWGEETPSMIREEVGRLK